MFKKQLLWAVPLAVLVLSGGVFASNNTQSWDDHWDRRIEAERSGTWHMFGSWFMMPHSGDRRDMTWDHHEFSWSMIPHSGDHKDFTWDHPMFSGFFNWEFPGMSGEWRWLSGNNKPRIGRRRSLSGSKKNDVEKDNTGKEDTYIRNPVVENKIHQQAKQWYKWLMLFFSPITDTWALAERQQTVTTALTALLTGTNHTIQMYKKWTIASGDVETKITALVTVFHDALLPYVDASQKGNFEVYIANKIATLVTAIQNIIK